MNKLKINTNLTPSEIRQLGEDISKAGTATKDYVPQNVVEANLLRKYTAAMDTVVSVVQDVCVHSLWRN